MTITIEIKSPEIQEKVRNMDFKNPYIATKDIIGELLKDNHITTKDEASSLDVDHLALENLLYDNHKVKKWILDRYYHRPAIIVKI